MTKLCSRKEGKSLECFALAQCKHLYEERKTSVAAVAEGELVTGATSAEATASSLATTYWSVVNQV